MYAILYIYRTPCYTISTLLAREACRASKSVDISRGLPRVNIDIFKNEACRVLKMLISYNKGCDKCFISLSYEPNLTEKQNLIIIKLL